ncbi:MAG: hypothetical protein LBT45_00535 [Rickettsiales bacterium]|jgi:hypothetical protein|nr:hypothetical protein [Rickettsiales bacterium]
MDSYYGSTLRQEKEARYHDMLMREGGPAFGPCQCLANLYSSEYYPCGAYVKIIRVSKIYINYLCNNLHVQGDINRISWGFGLYCWADEKSIRDYIELHDNLYEWKDESKTLLRLRPAYYGKLNLHTINERWPESLIRWAADVYMLAFKDDLVYASDHESRLCKDRAQKQI